MFVSSLTLCQFENCEFKNHSGKLRKSSNILKMIEEQTEKLTKIYLLLNHFLPSRTQHDFLNPTFQLPHSNLCCSSSSLLCKNILYFLLTPNDLECNNFLAWTLLGTGFVITEPEVYGRGKEKDEIVKIQINNV